MTSINLSAAEAARKILGFYDTIPAMDPKAFAAGLVEILSNYPQAVLERAVSPSRGLAGAVSYPNLAKFKEHLDAWRDEYYLDQDRIERANRKRLPEPEPDPEMEARIAKGLRELADQLRRGIGPSTV
ncbi:hypothetical protein [Bradyrhizobium sp. Leo121]|uniref:hypothetical protein n=1 Tax=Bradyrhizobium sp. Leo121 TaxID=1571195 RepID=UPI0010D536B9|nr:hypothetical protein [Bradyrhizobium sp. Leo121]RZN19479.1 hypothetical protein CWO90_35200 [Bradyrhizobium sp. Leo121]